MTCFRRAAVATDWLVYYIDENNLNRCLTDFYVGSKFMDMPLLLKHCHRHVDTIKLAKRVLTVWLRSFHVYEIFFISSGGLAGIIIIYPMAGGR